eukprot:TRINITY_DN4794_c2_g1_i1.p1 TRINITY_DN4794_c2_g1~~TRINITY_DN4794_c2_g1_i1.p1  ORF type:complete len:245 (+),score=95.56 TRINITY_DN4794_c2_g1_i1:94-735(+)
MFQALFGVKQKTPQELAKEWKAQLRQEDRKLDRQIRDLERSEKKVMDEVRKAAKKGDNASVKILAKEIAGARKAKKRFYVAKAQLNSVSLSLQQQMSQMKLAQVMQGSTQIMKSMNSLVRVEEIQGTMIQMQKEMMKTGMMQEVMDDTLDDALGDEGLEEEADEEVAKIIDEIMMGKLGGATAPALPQAAPAAAQAEPEQEDLQARLAALRGA